MNRRIRVGLIILGIVSLCSIWRILNENSIKYIIVYRVNPTKWIEKRFNLSGLSLEHEMFVQNEIIEIGLENNDSDEVKTRKIALFVMSRLDQYRDGKQVNYGHEGDAVLEWWRQLMTGNWGADCVVFSTAYALWANEMGIPTRLVHIRTPDGLEMKMHTVAESFWYSTGQWVVVDLVNGAIIIKDKYGNPLNTFQLAKILADQKTMGKNLWESSIYVEIADGDFPINANFAEIDKSKLEDMESYYNRDTYLMYYGDNIQKNSWIMIKLSNNLN